MKYNRSIMKAFLEQCSAAYLKVIIVFGGINV